MSDELTAEELRERGPARWWWRLVPYKTVRSRCWYCDRIFTIRWSRREGCGFMDAHYCRECR